jgi:hypothetical protein
MSVFYIHIPDIAAQRLLLRKSFCGSATVANLVATPGSGGNSVGLVHSGQRGHCAK